MKFIFWFTLFIVFYTFIGYGFVLYLLVKFKRYLGKRPTMKGNVPLPTLTLIVAAYNEALLIGRKIENTLQLYYPPEKIRYIFITDGSTDGTEAIINNYPAIELMHSPERKGKINAVHRAMEGVTSEIVVFTDANTFLNTQALANIGQHYADERVGAVSGEKRVSIADVSDATGGEGFYWKYESLLKKWDSELYSVVGAAGELFSIRTSLYTPVPPDTILDDFMISMLIASKGYKIVYEPTAFAVEDSSANITEELKRKIRIAAGGMQSIMRLPALLNFFRFGILTFQYISHRVLRWTITPFCMILTLVVNVMLVILYNEFIFQLLLIAQLLFYTLAIIGKILESRKLKVKIFFIPYYFCLMNYAVIAGIKRFALGKQSAIWEKAKRK